MQTICYLYYAKLSTTNPFWNIFASGFCAFFSFGGNLGQYPAWSGFRVQCSVGFDSRCCVGEKRDPKALFCSSFQYFVHVSLHEDLPALTYGRGPLCDPLAKVEGLGGFKSFFNLGPTCSLSYPIMLFSALYSLFSSWESSQKKQKTKVQLQMQAIKVQKMSAKQCKKGQKTKSEKDANKCCPRQRFF